MGRSEFLERYAREDAVIQRGLRQHWYPLMLLLNGENKKGLKAKPVTYSLTVEQFHKCLQKGLEMNLFGASSKVTTEQLADLIANLETGLKDTKGLVQYDKWLQKYVGDFYSIHFALTGNDSDMMPKWDAVIACFEMLDQCRAATRHGEVQRLKRQLYSDFV